MQVIPSFDPSALSGNINVNAADAGCKILLYNLSIYAIMLNFEDGATAVLHPGEANHWTLNDPTPTIAWTQFAKLNVNSPAISQVTVQLFRQDETIEGTYPTFFGYQFNVGNTLTVSQGAFQVLQNDGNASGTVIAESTVSGSPGSNVIVQNQGLIQVLQWVGGVLTQIFKTDPGAASVVKLANTGLLAEVLGNLKVDGTTELVGNTKIDGTTEMVGNATADGNLTVTGTASFNANGATIDGSSNFNGNAINTNTVNTGVVNATTVNATTLNATGNINPTGNIILENNTPLQFEDSTDAARNVLNVDASNNVNLQGVTGKDIIQWLASGGGVAGLIDLVNKSLDIRTTAVNLNGTTAGSAQLYMPFTGANFKLAILIFNGYQNNTANEQTIALPVAFSTRCNWISGNGKSVRPYSGGTALTSKVNKNDGGVTTGSNTCDANWMGEIIQGFDALGLGINEASQAFAIYTFIGI